MKRSLNAEEKGTLLAILLLILLWVALGPLGHIWPESKPELRDEYAEDPRR